MQNLETVNFQTSVNLFFECDEKINALKSAFNVIETEMLFARHLAGAFQKLETNSKKN